MTHHEFDFSIGGRWATDGDFLLVRTPQSPLPMVRQLLCTACTLLDRIFVSHEHPCVACPYPIERSGQAPAKCSRAVARSGRRAQFARLSRSGRIGQHPRCRSVHQPSRQGRSAAHRPGLHGDLRGGKSGVWFAYAMSDLDLFNRGQCSNCKIRMFVFVGLMD